MVCEVFSPGEEESCSKELWKVCSLFQMPTVVDGALNIIANNFEVYFKQWQATQLK